MKRHIHDMSIQVDSDSDFTPSSKNSHNSTDAFVLKRRVTRKQAETPADRHSMNERSPKRVYELARPTWPANDPVTPAISEKKIRELERGTEDERLMAAFARHIINPGDNHPKQSKWVSRRSLRKTFSEHFGHNGFFRHSPWKDKKAADFGLPELFLRSVDMSRALFSPHESVDDLFQDLGQAPTLDALTDEEHQQLRNRFEHGALLTNDKPQSPVPSNQSVQNFKDEDHLNKTEDRSDIPRPSKRLPSMSPAKPQTGGQTEAYPLLGPGWATPHRKSPPGTKTLVSHKTKHSTPSRKPGLSTPNTRILENSNTHLASQQPSDQRLSAKPRTEHEHTPKPLQQQQADTSNNQDQSKPPQSVSAPATNDMRAVKAIVVPKIYDILKDFPNSPEDPSFLPLLRQLVKVTIGINAQAIEERHLDLHTHVVMHCTSNSPTDLLETATLVRPMLKLLSRLRHKLAGQIHSQIQRDINAAAKVNNLNRLRVLHAELLLFEAQPEGDQSGQ